MKKFLIYIVMCLISCTAIFAGCGCGDKGFKDNPKVDDAIIGNGGYAVSKGDYLYYTNGTDTKENASKDSSLGAIYRVKLNNGKVEVDDEGYVVGAEQVTKRVTAYDKGGFHIYGNYIYYVTPNLGVDHSGNDLLEYIELRRVNINGTDDKSIYQASKSSSSVTWSMTTYNGKVYFVNLDESDLEIVDANTGNTIHSVKNVSSYKIYSPQDVYKDSNNGAFSGKVFYSRSAVTDKDAEDKDNFTGNGLFSIDFDGSNEKFIDSNSSSYEIVEMTSDKMFYKVSGKNNVYVYDGTNTKELFNHSYTSIYATDNMLVTYANSDITLYKTDGTENINPTIIPTVSKLLAVRNNSIYYVSNNSYYRYSNGVSNEILFTDLTVDVETIHLEAFGNYITFVESITGKDGTNRTFVAKLNITNGSVEHLAVFNGDMRPEKEESDTNTENN